MCGASGRGGARAAARAVATVARGGPRRVLALFGRRTRAALCLAPAVLALTLAAGCGPAASSPGHGRSPSPKALSCGMARTAADVPVRVEVTKGHVPCRTAMTIERRYAEAIRSGKAPGNGGGGPVRVRGWICQGFATPVVLQTGKASKCVRGGTEILEILPVT